MLSRFAFRLSCWCALGALTCIAMAGTTLMAQARKPAPTKAPITLADQGSFAVGGAVLTNPGTFDPVNPTEAGQTVHGDHAYVMYQIPVNARRLPLVMWHGGGQFSKTWETTPDGRDGFQNIFVKQKAALSSESLVYDSKPVSSTEFASTPVQIPAPYRYSATY